MKSIAIIGYGVVGGGITAVLETNSAQVKRTAGDDVQVKYILDLRDFPDSPYADRVVHDIQPILDDPEVVLVCETMGGSHPALEFSVACMKAGKSVVTSNKEVVANFGDQLLQCAKENGVRYLFEASVGGGIPVIRSLLTSVACDRIEKVAGIVNGTTNYILTKMENEGCSFESALTEAQMLGYAEKDPTADVDGIDAQRKIIILNALATGVLLNSEDVYAEGIRNITAEDMAAAKKLGGSIKLIAGTDTVTARVCPMIVKNDNPLAHIQDVFNGILATTSACGDILYYGRGAGRYPTAGAVVADVCAVLSGAADREYTPVFAKSDVKPPEFAEISFVTYIRAECGRNELTDLLKDICDKTDVISDENGVVEVIADRITADQLDEIRAKVNVKSAVRVLD
ncbi:MAG: homoserine dehydrogenase [Clostridia bacterium]|nr:homoserine dehydrogenase [Clostridia bacterium]